VDNEADEVVEQDIIDLLATQSEEVDNDEVEIDTDTDDINVLKDRIAKRNKTIKKSKQANHRIQEENSALEQRLEELEKMINSPAPNVEAQNQERQEALEKWRESVADDPGKAVDFANWQANDQMERIVNLFTQQQETFNSEIASLKGEIDPERTKYREQINKLKTNPAYAAIPEEHLLTFVKGAERVHRNDSIGGKRVQAQNTSEKDLEELRERVRKQING